jgi:hypothetical protein
MKTSKIFFPSVLSFLVVCATFFNAFADDNPKKNTLKNKEKQVRETLAYSQEELNFIAEMDAYYTKKYSNPLNLVQSKIEKVIVSNAQGTIIQELDVPDHKIHEASLPAKAEKLMVKGNTAYYVVL